MADQRLNLLKKRFLKDPDMFLKYSEIIEDLCSKDYAEVPKEEIEKSNRKIWFLPHHSVFHPKKPDKVRVVFDCAAKYSSSSSEVGRKGCI